MQIVSQWEKKPLGDIAVIRNETPDLTEAKELKIVDSSDIDGELGQIDPDKVKSFSSATNGNRKPKSIKENDVVIWLGNLKKRKVAIVPKALDGHLCSAELCVLEPKSHVVSASYLWLVCRSELVRGTLLAENKTKISETKFRKLEIYLPHVEGGNSPSKPQANVFAYAWELLQRLHAAWRIQRSMQEDMPKLWTTVLMEFFPSLSECPSGWTIDNTLKTLAKDWKAGYSKSGKSTGEKAFIVQTATVAAGDPDWNDPTKFKNVDNDSMNSLGLQKDDVLIATVGFHVGKSCIIRKNPTVPAIYDKSIIRIRAQGIVPLYIYYFLQSNTYWQQLRQEERGSAQRFIAQKSLAEIKVPRPSSEPTMHRIVHQCQQAEHAIRKIRDIANTSEAHLTMLERTIFDHVFEGTANE